MIRLILTLKPVKLQGFFIQSLGSCPTNRNDFNVVRETRTTELREDKEQAAAKKTRRAGSRKKATAVKESAPVEEAATETVPTETVPTETVPTEEVPEAKATPEAPPKAQE